MPVSLTVAGLPAAVSRTTRLLPPAILNGMPQGLWSPLGNLPTFSASSTHHLPRTFASGQLNSRDRLTVRHRAPYALDLLPR